MNTTVQKQTRIQWIDFMKAIAIFAVLVDHTYGILHTNLKISYGSFFSVTLFILISGVTSYTSFLRRKDIPYGEDLKRKLKAILIPYGIATAVYGIIAIRYFDLMTFLNFLIHFSAAKPFYFIVVYLQLIILSRPICKLVNSMCISNRTTFHKCLLYAASSVVVLVISSVSINYSFVTNIADAGERFVFGGTFLFIYYIGHVIGANIWKMNSKITNMNKPYIYIYILISSSAVCGIIVKHFTDRGFTSNSWFGTGKNPPGISIMIYTMAVFGLLLSVNWFIDRVSFKPLIFVRNIIAWFGKYSLYIFLFHIAVLNILNQSSIPIWCADHIWMKRFIYIGIIIGTCVIIGIVIERILKHGKEDFGKLLIWIRK